MTTSHLQPAPGFNFQAVLKSHGWRRLRPFRWDADAPGVLGYTLALPTGRAVALTITDGVTVYTAADLTAGEAAHVRQAVRRMLDFDTDLTPFYDRLRGIPRYAWVAPAGAGRMLASASVWEDLVKTLLTTNVSWTNTVSMVGRLCDYGTPAADGSRAFPSPAQVLAQPPDALNAHVRAGYRAKSLFLLAEAVESGAVDVESWRGAYPGDSATLYKAITDLHGFGAYAAGALMRLLGRHDYLGLDSVCREAYARRFNDGDKAPDDEIRAFYEPFGAWRGLALWMDVIAPGRPAG